MRTRNMPGLWLMTDERGGDPAVSAASLPRGSGIVFRHHATPARARRALYARVRSVARRRRLILLLAGPPALARNWGADGAHDRSARPSQGLRSVAVHNGRELETARRAGADLIFVSPVFATQSHVQARPLGIVRLGLLVAHRSPKVIALGGMNRAKRRRLGRLVYGWAGIDAFSQQNAHARPHAYRASETERGSHIDGLAVAPRV